MIVDAMGERALAPDSGAQNSMKIKSGPSAPRIAAAKARACSRENMDFPPIQPGVLSPEKLGSMSKEQSTMLNNVAAEQLKLLLERIERLEEEKKGISDDIKDVYLEGKATGYDAAIMRQIVRLRKMKPNDRQEMEAILQSYLSALGME